MDDKTTELLKDLQFFLDPGLFIDLIPRPGSFRSPIAPTMLTEKVAELRGCIDAVLEEKENYQSKRCPMPKPIGPGITMTLTDGAILKLYELWSEDTYAASFLSPSPGAVKQFRDWLRSGLTREASERYEVEMLTEFYKQLENKGVSGGSGST